MDVDVNVDVDCAGDGDLGLAAVPLDLLMPDFLLMPAIVFARHSSSAQSFLIELLIFFLEASEISVLRFFC